MIQRLQQLVHVAPHQLPQSVPKGVGELGMEGGGRKRGEEEGGEGGVDKAGVGGWRGIGGWEGKGGVSSLSEKVWKTQGKERIEHLLWQPADKHQSAFRAPGFRDTILSLALYPSTGTTLTTFGAITRAGDRRPSGPPAKPPCACVKSFSVDVAPPPSNELVKTLVGVCDGLVGWPRNYCQGRMYC